MLEKARTQGLWLEGKEGVGHREAEGVGLQSHKCQANPWVSGNPDQHCDDFLRCCYYSSGEMSYQGRELRPSGNVLPRPGQQI